VYQCFGLRDVQERVKEMTVEKANIPKSKIKNIFKSKVDWFLTAEESLKYGVVDEILE